MSSRKIVLVTGSTTGLGYQCALRIATSHSKTHRVVIASRSLPSVNAAVENIRKKLKPEDHEAVIGCAVALDLSSLASVKSFAEWASEEYPVIDSLVLNAGTGAINTVEKSKDGFESAFAVNHLGHFYLTQLLLTYLLKSSQPRLVVVSSGLHNPMYGLTPPLPWTENSPADWANGDPDVAKALTVYPFSKLCNVLFAHELRTRVTDPRLAIYVFDPGFCRSTSLRRGFNWFLRNVVEFSITAILWIRDVTGITPHRQLSSTFESGNLMASFAADEKWVGSLTALNPVRYFAIATETESSVDSYNKEYQQKLWEFSENVVAEKMGSSN
ncbi:hypothetical protein BJ742DRAFT_514523 [Cladochytrium replicatum]|nr:hypothetical protein BJ742DRAFT_514523 [Cladochytrium replicatum]